MRAAGTLVTGCWTGLTRLQADSRREHVSQSSAATAQPRQQQLQAPFEPSVPASWLPALASRQAASNSTKVAGRRLLCQQGFPHHDFVPVYKWRLQHLLLAKNAACVLSDQLQRAEWQMKLVWRICLQVASLEAVPAGAVCQPF